jgi:glucose-6-phosphate 1-epimerase
MTSDVIDALNAQHAISGQLAFADDLGDLVVARITNQHATAAVALQGGQVVGYTPHGAQPVLFVSRQSHYAPGKAIRGGIPVCWPWFGPHPSDASKPQHGFARTRPWQVLGASVADGGATVLRLGLADDAATQALWPHAFALELVVSVGAALAVTLIARNTGDAPFACTGALHSYFAVGDISAITIHGLDGATYVDKVAGGQEQVQHGPITIGGEVDRVYRDTSAACHVEDPALGRRIVVAKEGSRSTVVWNPWQAKAAQLADMADDEYQTFVCVETSNALDDVVTLAPNEEHRLTAMISVEGLGARS